MSSGVVRFCPYCAVYHRKKYTTWTLAKGGREVCENDKGLCHGLDILWGKYGYYLNRELAHLQIGRVTFTDDGLMCDGKKYRARILGKDANGGEKMFNAVMEAMVDEVASGIFTPHMWIDSFPRRTAECGVRMIGAWKAALLPCFPPPLVGIIVAYLW